MTTFERGIIISAEAVHSLLNDELFWFGIDHIDICEAFLFACFGLALVPIGKNSPTRPLGGWRRSTARAPTESSMLISCIGPMRRRFAPWRYRCGIENATSNDF